MSSHLRPAVSSKDHISGSSTAALELVEYGDYQCSYCGKAYYIMKDVQKALRKQIRFVFRNFPLTEVHPDAFNAALAAEAAGLQNNFWEMHDMLYENQENLDMPSIISYAQAIELDVSQFEDDIQSKAISDKVEADFESGIRSGVKGTPSFFINRQKYNGDWSDTELTQYLRDQL